MLVGGTRILLLISFKLVCSRSHPCLALFFHTNPQFQLFCNTIQDAAQFHAKNMFQAMDMCGQAITSAAIATNATFPYVTVPNFEILGAATRAQSGMEMLLWQPILVNDNEKEVWIEYSLQNQGWVNESRALATKNAEQQQQQESSIITYSPANYIYNSIPDMIWDRDENLVVRPTVAPPPFIPYVRNRLLCVSPLVISQWAAIMSCFPYTVLSLLICPHIVFGK
jgi:hypothetical protein